MVQINLKGKKITIDDELYDFMTKRYYEFDEDDCKYFLHCALTTGDFDTGFKCPDLDALISEKSESELSELIEKGIRSDKELLA